MNYNSSLHRIMLLKASLSAVIILFVTFSLQAQKFEAGVKAAGSFNNNFVKGSDSYLPTPIYGGSLGIYGTFNLFEKFKIRAEALMSSRGFKAQYSNLGAPTTSLSSGQATLSPNNGPTTNTYASTLDQETLYLDVPVGIDYNVISKVYLQAGGMVSVFVKEWKNSLSNNAQVEAQAPVDTKYYQYYQASVYGGAYYRFDMGLTAGARANLGLTNTYVSSIGAAAGNQIFPYSFQIFVTYSIFKF